MNPYGIARVYVPIHPLLFIIYNYTYIIVYIVYGRFSPRIQWL